MKSYKIRHLEVSTLKYKQFEKEYISKVKILHIILLEFITTYTTYEKRENQSYRK